MFSGRKSQSFASIAAGGVLLDPKIRRAALDAVPPLARLGWRLGLRAARHRARERLGRVLPVAQRVIALAQTVVPGLLVEFGVVEAPRRRRLLPKVAVAVIAGAAVIYLLEPGRGADRRRQIQRLIVH